MQLKSTFLTFAFYHHYAYDELLKHVKTIPDDDYKANKGLFFQSIHGTLNHLLLVDKLWYGRIIKKPIIIKSLADELFSDRNLLANELLQQASTWIKFIKDLEEDNMQNPCVYLDTHGNQQKKPLIGSLLHVFNHGTHHRGQITAVIIQLGLTSPVLDLTYFLQ